MYDYAGGKLDWAGFGLPVEGEAAAQPMVGRLADPRAPSCRPEERLRDFRGRLGARSWCAVLDARGVVLGRVRRRRLDDAPDAEARAVMEPGPSTYRPSLPAAELLQAMREGRFDAAFVTDSDGRWLGLVTRSDLESVVRD